MLFDAVKATRVAALVVVAALGAGCGPTQSTSFQMDAEVMLEAARTAQAEKYAPYEWTAATLYLHKSKEEAGYADWEQSVDYGKKAVDFAKRARDAALKTTKRAEPPTAPAEP